MVNLQVRYWQVSFLPFSLEFLCLLIFLFLFFLFFFLFHLFCFTFPFLFILSFLSFASVSSFSFFSSFSSFFIFFASFSPSFFNFYLLLPASFLSSKQSENFTTPVCQIEYEVLAMKQTICCCKNLKK